MSQIGRVIVLQILYIGVLPLSMNSLSLDISGNVSLKHQYFVHDPRLSEQGYNYVSISLEQELYRAWNDEDDSLLFKPFVKYSPQSSGVTLYDIRELYWLHESDNWRLCSGISKVFWGVAESQHLVDVINQTDFSEDLDGEVKLGQPMLYLSTALNIGDFNFYLLPGFRERRFPGAKDRLRVGLPIDNQAAYESSANTRRVDTAFRWSHILGNVDLAFAHFSGTSREPEFIPVLSESALTILKPFYPVIDQSSVELSYVNGNWLWKFEGLTRSGQSNGRFSALVGGFEYTYIAVAGSEVDLGMLLEYSFDDRGAQASTVFQDDIFFGLRFVFNDVWLSDLLVGAVRDTTTDSEFFLVEYSRGFKGSFRLSLESRFFSEGNRAYDLINSFAEDDYMELSLDWYF